MSEIRKNEKIKHFLFDNRFLILAFGCSAAIMLVVFMAFGLFPFGDTTILRMDLYHQYGPLFAELYDRVTSGGSLMYSWNSGLGSSFFGNYCNYLSSPIGFLVMLIAGHKNIPEAIAVMVLLKAALSALTFSLYLKKSQHKSNYITVGFAVLYSFCGWFIAYYWNVMWIDAMILLPLVALGIERIIDNGKPWLYLGALALTMLSNYYMSYMMCIFAVMYFIAYYITNHTASEYKRFFKSGFIFAGVSVCAAGLIAFMLLPTFCTLQQTSATSGNFPTDSSLYFNIFDFLSNHLASVEPTIRSSGNDVLPNVYCGILTVMLIPLYLMTKSISKKEKLVNITFLSAFMIGFNLNILNYIWHGFHFPNDLPYRQSFMYSFLLLVVAFRTFTRLKEIPNKVIAFSGFAAAALVILAEKLNSKNVNTSTVIISLVFIVIYALVIVTLKDKKYQTLTVSVLLLCCICSESIIANTGNYSMDQPKTNYVGDYDAFQTVKNQIDSVNTDKFYRMELSYLRTRMDPCWYNYNGVSTFSSMAYEKVSALQRKLGMYGNNINSYTYYPQTPIYNAMFSLKYLVNNTTTDVFANSSLYKEIYKYDKYTAYENEYALPIAYCVDTAVSNWQWSMTDPFDVQNDLFEKATGVSDALVDLYPLEINNSNLENFMQPLDSEVFSFRKTSSDGVDGSSSFVFEAAETAHVYLYVTTGEGDDSGTMTVMTDGSQSVNQDLSKGYILDIGEIKKGSRFTAIVPITSSNGMLTFHACYLNKAAFAEGYEKLKATSISYDSFTDTSIEGSFTAKGTQILMTSIPYDSGWSVYIDGKKVDKNDIVTIGDSMLGVNVTDGRHTIKMLYTPTGFKLGVAISIFTLIILLAAIAVCVILRKKGRKMKGFDEIDQSFDSEPFISSQAEAVEIRLKQPDRQMKQLPKKEIIEPIDIFVEDEEISPDAVTSQAERDEETFEDFFSKDRNKDEL
ncbi:MAG: YfhO family protein [Acutalibacteraceae bacterium]